MSNIGTFERIVSSVLHKTTLGLTASLCLAVNMPQTSNAPNPTLESFGIELDFTEFSPAYAALEDEFLFSQPEKGEALMAGRDNSLYYKLLNPPTDNLPKVQVVRVEHEKPKKSLFQSFLASFDGGIAANDIDQHLQKVRARGRKPAVMQKAQVKNEELEFGSLMALAHSPASQPTVNSPLPANELMAQPVPNKTAETEVQQQGRDDVVVEYKTFKVGGSLRLTEGLAFIGAMDVTWVVGDYILKVGSINTPDATYEIEVNQLIGDVIVSLYGENDELIGEGILDLSSTSHNEGEIHYDIDIKPMDWDRAGMAVSHYSIGQDVEKAVDNVEIALYSFNETTTTDVNGVFRFFNWKVTNSRSLAIASKEGFRDSIFMLDSKQEARVIMFENKAMDTLFDYLENEGIRDVENRGTIYGNIIGTPEKEAFNVVLKGHDAIYFAPAGVADVSLRSPSENGLFAFVGLQDGDYELMVEKEGEVVDRRVVVVEQGKMSPVIIDMKYLNKHLSFYDPLAPDQAIDAVDISFFDGVKHLSLDEGNIGKASLTSGHDPGLLDFATDNDISRTFVSRHKEIERIPLLNNPELLKIAEDHQMNVDDGLVYGFVEYDRPFQAYLVESSVEKSVYFDQQGQIVDPREQVAYGFILSGFHSGLSSLVIEDLADQMIVATDLIFSDNDAISVLHLSVHPPEK